MSGFRPIYGTGPRGIMIVDLFNIDYVRERIFYPLYVRFLICTQEMEKALVRGDIDAWAHWVGERCLNHQIEIDLALFWYSFCLNNYYYYFRRNDADAAIYWFDRHLEIVDAIGGRAPLNIFRPQTFDNCRDNC
jgi:hypothetical protein